MPALLRCLSRPYHNDDTGISTKNKSPSLSVTYRAYKECTCGPRDENPARRRFPLWSVHPPDENPAQMPTSSSCPTEIKGLQSSGTCQTLCSTSVEPLGRYSPEIFFTDAGEPMSYEEASASADSTTWHLAMESEMHSIRANKTWDLVDLPKN